MGKIVQFPDKRASAKTRKEERRVLKEERKALKREAVKKAAQEEWEQRRNYKVGFGFTIKEAEEKDRIGVHLYDLTKEEMELLNEKLNVDGLTLSFDGTDEEDEK